jgi:hypothetical protein
VISRVTLIVRFDVFLLKRGWYHLLFNVWESAGDYWSRKDGCEISGVSSGRVLERDLDGSDSQESQAAGMAHC